MEGYLGVNLLGPGPRLMEKEFTRGLTKAEKHWFKFLVACNAARHLVGQMVPGPTHSRIRFAPALRESKTVGV